MPHRVLALFVSGCSRTPFTATGDPEIAQRIGAADFARLSGELDPGRVWLGEAELAGQRRPLALATEAASTLLLVRADRQPLAPAALATLEDAWAVFALATQDLLDTAPPSGLNASRAAAGERERVAATLGDAYGTALSGVLGTLRARHLDDHAARRTATDLAAAALVGLRTAVDAERELGDEPLGEAFARLRGELTPLVRASAARLELVDPAGAARLSPSVAQAARAISRAAVMALMEAVGANRLRVSWTVGEALQVTVRDDGAGAPAPAERIVAATADRARALGGDVDVEAVPGWGTRVLATLPLGDATGVDAGAPDPFAALRPRELEVLAQLAVGRRNRQIAEALSISENTVKFHVANVLGKLGVGSRNEAALLARDAGFGADAALSGS